MPPIALLIKVGALILFVVDGYLHKDLKAWGLALLALALLF